jgi:alkylated DNA repair dioxygenase AlkB
MNAPYPEFESHLLDERHHFFEGRLPNELRPDAARFETLWNLHPDDYHVIKIHGRLVKTPRWQQAYGADYHYTGRTNVALPMTPELEPVLKWGRSTIHPGLNGLLLNWYDGNLGHYIGPHHDSNTNMVDEAPIVTISLGEVRIFRLSHPKTKATRDFVARDGTVFVMPYDTNRVWKHAVPRFARYEGRRISITLRAFVTA